MGAVHWQMMRKYSEMAHQDVLNVVYEHEGYATGVVNKNSPNPRPLKHQNYVLAAHGQAMRKHAELFRLDMRG